MNVALTMMGEGGVPHRLQLSLGGGGGLSGVYRVMLGFEGGRVAEGPG